MGRVASSDLMESRENLGDLAKRVLREKKRGLEEGEKTEEEEEKRERDGDGEVEVAIVEDEREKERATETLG